MSITRFLIHPGRVIAEKRASIKYFFNWIDQEGFDPQYGFDWHLTVQKSICLWRGWWVLSDFFVNIIGEEFGASIWPQFQPRIQVDFLSKNGKTRPSDGKHFHIKYQFTRERPQKEVLISPTKYLKTKQQSKRAFVALNQSEETSQSSLTLTCILKNLLNRARF